MKPHRGAGKKVSLKQAAEEEGLAYGTLYQLVKDGQIPHIRVNRTIYLRRADLEEFFEARTQRGVA